MNHNLKICASKGHAFYIPQDDPDLFEKLTEFNYKEEIMLQCLRCDGFYVNYRKDSITTKRANIPVIMRGDANKHIGRLRLIACERWIRSIFLLIVSFGLFDLSGKGNHAYTSFVNLTEAASPLANKLGFSIQRSHTLHLIEHFLNWSHAKYVTVAFVVLLYALLQIVEGFGLWIGSRWGEYLAATATGAFIPLEVYEINNSSSYFKLIALLVNVGVVAYLVTKDRLFGVRGGGAKYRKELYETTLLSEIDKYEAESEEYEAETEGDKSGESQPEPTVKKATSLDETAKLKITETLETQWPLEDKGNAQ